MQETRAFAPLYLHSNTLPSQVGAILNSVTATGAVGSTTELALPGNTSINNFSQIRIANKTSAWAHVNFGLLGSVVAATLNHPAVAPGGVEVFSVDPEVNAVRVICDAAPASATAVMFTRGGGL